ncbi:hypothetical protein [Micromonospora rosaria]|uniref:hypothetical protein n=1 Tax=Micromonospora rosaria TaxID=47874 RepID=UPI000B1874FE|nr:hypothetical protein [Micromonospora rosaria]
MSRTAAHQHASRTTSTHRTSEGRVHYQRCACGRWRILLTTAGETRPLTVACHP